MWLCAQSVSTVQPGWALAFAIFLVRTHAKYLLQDSGYRHVGCEIFTGGTYTRDMSRSDQCQGGTRRCQPCFVFDTSYNPVHLTLTACFMNRFASATSTTVVPDYRFINVDRHAASVTVGVTTYYLPMGGQPGSTISCTCMLKYGQEILTCDTSQSFMHYNRAYDQLYVMDNCATINTDLTLNLGSKSCNNRYCPNCFMLDTGSGSVTLTARNCGNWQGLELETTATIEYMFQNSGSNLGFVSDRTNTYTLSPYGSGGSSMHCLCYGESLSCTSPTIRADAATENIATFPASLLMNGPLYLDTGKTNYLRYDSTGSAMEFLVGSTRMLSLASTSTLHGTWQADGLITTSDVRLKKDIRPLRETLHALKSGSQAASNELQDGSSEAVQADPVQWALSKLRPVSYRYVSQNHTGNRFGFIADDVEQVLPDMVRVGEDDARTKSLLLLDFIALLVSALQGQQQVIDDLSRRSDEQHREAGQRISAIEQKLESVVSEVGLLSQRMDKCAATCEL
mmetsp:Transcript_100220/g.188903  ORF Transcript_100220/g.188903 Transcript_100220/m.188903 type:complete len:510 (-) Transcript_100220:40-1569(-)